MKKKNALVGIVIAVVMLLLLSACNIPIPEIFYNLTLMIQPVDGGVINGGAEGEYQEGDIVNLEAVANVGFEFAEWLIGGELFSEDQFIQYEMPAHDVTLTANFTIKTYEITAEADPAEGGAVAGAGTFEHGEEAQLTATAADNYTFVRWTKDGVEVSTEAVYTFNVTEAGHYVAHFAIDTYEITAEADPAEGGAVAGAATYAHGDTVELTATPAAGYNFVNWTKGGVEVSTEAVYEFTAEAAGHYVANFELKTYEITTEAAPVAGGNTAGDATYTHGDAVVLTATPAAGYNFVNWTKGGVEVSTEDVYEFTAEAAGHYVANFELKTYEITTEAAPAVGGDTDGDATYTHGDAVVLTATPADGYEFVNWTKGVEEVSTEDVYEFTAEAAGHYVANFAEVQWYEGTEIFVVSKTELPLIYTYDLNIEVSNANVDYLEFSVNGEPTEPATLAVQDLFGNGQVRVYEQAEVMVVKAFDEEANQIGLAKEIALHPVYPYDIISWSEPDPGAEEVLLLWATDLVVDVKSPQVKQLEFSAEGFEDVVIPVNQGQNDISLIFDLPPDKESPDVVTVNALDLNDENRWDDSYEKSFE